jgi:Family of unknown function (DUF5947)
VAGPSGTVGSSRLRRLARRPQAPAEAEEERCDLCGEPIPPQHRHLLDLRSRELMCACRACATLFDRRAAGAGHYRRVPDRRLFVDDFELDDASWANLRIPVEMAFFFDNTQAERVVAFYPSPMGATESLLELDAWQELEEANPVLRTLEPDVEALLVNRARGARQHFVVPIEDCYELVGLIRTRWRGLSGGQEVWQEIDRFFERLARRARATSRDGSSAAAAEGAGG